MKKEILSVSFILIFLFLSLNGCIELPTDVPDDFKLEYSWGACHAEWGRYTLIINSTGLAIYKYSEWTEIENKSYNFSEEELLEIYKECIKNRFYELNNKYYDANVIDGSCSYIQLIADEKSHRVSVSNKNIIPFDNITKKIMEILNSKEE